MKKNSTALETTRGGQALSLSPDDIQTLVSASIIPRDTPEGTIRMFGRFCAESNLSPFKRQVHLIKRGDKFTIQTGIDGYRSIADRTGCYAGNDDYAFDEGLSEYQHIAIKKNVLPITATATVYKIVQSTRVPFAATARWTEYCPADGQNFMWKKMPYLMLGKTAEALALRKAFPNELGGIYTDEEMQQVGTPLQESAVHQSYQPEEQAEHSEPVTVAGASFETFDPKTELIGFGKYKGMTWLEVPNDYLQWIVENATKAEYKTKAQATLDYRKMNQEQMPSDPFDGAFDKSKKETKADPAMDPVEALEHSLDEVARRQEMDALEGWWKINFEEMKKLSKPAQAHITKLFTAAKKGAQKP